MSQVEVMYLQEGGHYRRRVCRLTPKWPKYLMNTKDRQAHIVKRQEIFPMVTPIRLETWADLVEADPPDPPPAISWRQMVCQDNGMWPHSPIPEIDPQEVSRDRRDGLQAGLQDAYVAGARARTPDWFMQASGITVLGIAAVAFLMIVLIVVSGR